MTKDLVLLAGSLLFLAGVLAAPPTGSSDDSGRRSVSVRWGNLGAQLVEAGVIDPEKMEVFSGERLTITKENAGYALNLLWAFGLANKNPILEDETEMMNPEYGGAGRFASTGGWTLSRGETMAHYSMHAFVPLTEEQQARVDKVSRGIYRPCCNNSAHFPDCNHGMAMLGLLELMASEGASEEEMRDAALVVNSYWFPDAYQASCSV